MKIVDISDGNDTTPDAWNTVKFKKVLYGSDSHDYQALYYTVTLSEKLEHLFSVMDNLGFINLNSKVMAVAKITHVIEPVAVEHGPSLYQQMKALRNKESYATWDHIKHEYDITPKDKRPEAFKDVGTDNIARSRSVQAKGNEYVAGNFYRTETLTLHGWSQATAGYGNPTNTPQMDQRYLDNLFVDMKVDIKNITFSTDKDLGGDTNFTDDTGVGTSEYNLTTGNKQISDKTILNYRIHDLINIGRWHKTGKNSETGEEEGYYTYEYPVRTQELGKTLNKKFEREPPDPLYVYVENENIYSHEHQNTTAFNTVRQFIININVSNTNEATERPMMFFYDGPEKIKGGNTKNTWNEKWRESWKYLSDYENNLRNSLPVIINFNEDFRGTFFFPNSPVVINGNGHKFEGFVVAQEYLRLKTAADFPAKADSGTLSTERGCAVYKDENGVVLYHSAAKDGTKFIDEKGNVVYIKLNTTEPLSATDSDGTSKKYTDVDGNTVYINTTENPILYTYTKITKEKSNLLSTYTGSNAREKEYVPVNPMFIDQYGNVQYAPLSGNYTYSQRPQPLDSNWHSAYDKSDEEKYDPVDDANEIIYNPLTFGLSSVKYNSYYKVGLVDYTKLNNKDEESGKDINDVFYSTVRSDWID